MMQIRYPEIGICGISCRLCPSYYSREENVCNGCKDVREPNITCPLRVCAIKKRSIEFCWECKQSDSCEMLRDTLSKGCNAGIEYQSAEDNISFIKQNGVETSNRMQKTRGKLLNEMLNDYDEGFYIHEYCAAAAQLEVGEIEAALTQAWINTAGMELYSKSEYLLSVLNAVSTFSGRAEKSEN